MDKLATDLNEEVFKQTRIASKTLALLTTAQRNAALTKIADALITSQESILLANQKDCAAAHDISQALFARLVLTHDKLNEVVAGLRNLVQLDDPIGQVTYHNELDDDLILKKVTCPLGVIGIIFEARPDAMIQICALAIKSGNGVILKGGKEATLTNQKIHSIIQEALSSANIPNNALQLLTSRADVDLMLQQEKHIDLIIPRGSQALVRYVQENTQIPVIGHADGICHIYIDDSANLQQAIDIIIDSKTQYPSACNTVETLLINQNLVESFIPTLLAALEKHAVEIRLDAPLQATYGHQLAHDSDWATEYSDLILSIKAVEGIQQAIEHISTYGSGHTESILTDNTENAHLFFNQVDAASVLHNCSTRFADGFRYGFGAEVGVSTHKMPTRGPVGLEGLVTYKYQLTGKGHIVADYSGKKTYKHRDLLRAVKKD